jgi:hypothetical protein
LIDIDFHGLARGQRHAVQSEVCFRVPRCRRDEHFGCQNLTHEVQKLLPLRVRNAKRKFADDRGDHRLQLRRDLCLIRHSGELPVGVQIQPELDVTKRLRGGSNEGILGGLRVIEDGVAGHPFDHETVRARGDHTDVDQASTLAALLRARGVVACTDDLELKRVAPAKLRNKRDVLCNGRP